MSAMARNFAGATRPLQEAREKETVIGAHSAEHLATVEAQLAAIASGDYASALANVRDDIELDIFAPPEFAWLRRARGRQEFQKALEHNFGALSDQRPEITTVVAQDDVVIMIGREQGRIRETGQEYDVEFVHRFTFRDGRLASIRIIAARAGEAAR
jgi:ketosteroid isomerase-like protein